MVVPSDHWLTVTPATLVSLSVTPPNPSIALSSTRTPAAGRPLRTLFAFDPRRTAILLIGGDKTGDDRFYERMTGLEWLTALVRLNGLRKPAGGT